MDNAKTTPLHNWHTTQSVKMANFCGYEMPLWYSSAKKEHLAVLTEAGLFDTSHMTVITVTGKDAETVLQYCFTNNLAPCQDSSKKALIVGRCVYGAFLNKKGHVIDDAIIYRTGKESYMVVVNACMGNKITSHLTNNSNGRDILITDLTGRVGKIDIQGPMAARILSKVLVSPSVIFNKMSYFSFKGNFLSGSAPEEDVRLHDGIAVLLSRTGYTGEFGFEIFTDAIHLAKLWKKILDAGETFGLIPCGLAARDSLRTGAGLPLAHQDIGDWPFINHPWHFTLPFNDDNSGFTKTFIGDRALLNSSEPQYTYAFVGYDLRKVTASDQTAVIDQDGKRIGTVLTCVSDMAIGRTNEAVYSVTSPDRPEGFTPKGLSCGFIKVIRKLQYGQTLKLEEGRRKIEVVVTDNIRPDRTAHNPIQEMI
jgi:glycine cleavage system T protein (aminomethyltransferase)